MWLTDLFRLLSTSQEYKWNCHEKLLSNGENPWDYTGDPQDTK